LRSSIMIRRRNFLVLVLLAEREEARKETERDK
jgi:hypothetical protein